MQCGSTEGPVQHSSSVFLRPCVASIHSRGGVRAERLPSLRPLCLVFDQLFALDLAALSTVTVSAPLCSSFLLSHLTLVGVFAKLSAVREAGKSELLRLGEAACSVAT